MQVRWRAAWLPTSVLLIPVAACGTSRPAVSSPSVPVSTPAVSSPSVPATTPAASFSAKQRAYLRDARRTSGSIDAGDAGRDATLVAIGRDWCRWRRSSQYGSVTTRQWFGEIDVGAADSRIIRRAAEAHLCPR